MSLQTRIAAHAAAVAAIASDEGREEHLERRYSLGYRSPLFDLGILDVRQYRYTAVVKLEWGYVLVLERFNGWAFWRPYHVSRA